MHHITILGDPHVERYCSKDGLQCAITDDAGDAVAEAAIFMVYPEGHFP